MRYRAYHRSALVAMAIWAVGMGCGLLGCPGVGDGVAVVAAGCRVGSGGLMDQHTLDRSGHLGSQCCSGRDNDALSGVLRRPYGRLLRV